MDAHCILDRLRLSYWEFGVILLFLGWILHVVKYDAECGGVDRVLTN